MFGTDPGKEPSHTYRAVIPVTIAVSKDYVRNVNGWLTDNCLSSRCKTAIITSQLWESKVRLSLTDFSVRRSDRTTHRGISQSNPREEAAREPKHGALGAAARDRLPFTFIPMLLILHPLN